MTNRSQLGRVTMRMRESADFEQPVRGRAARAVGRAGVPAVERTESGVHAGESAEGGIDDGADEIGAGP